MKEGDFIPYIISTHSCPKLVKVLSSILLVYVRQYFVQLGEIKTYDIYDIKYLIIYLEKKKNHASKESLNKSNWITINMPCLGVWKNPHYFFLLLFKEKKSKNMRNLTSENLSILSKVIWLVNNDSETKTWDSLLWVLDHVKIFLIRSVSILDEN